MFQTNECRGGGDSGGGEEGGGGGGGGDSGGGADGGGGGRESVLKMKSHIKFWDEIMWIRMFPDFSQPEHFFGYNS
jgi:hypothetical protein